MTRPPALVWTGAAEVVAALAAIVVTPPLVHALGVESYGVLGVVGVLAGQLSALHLGVGPAAMRRLPEAASRGESGGSYVLSGLVLTAGGTALTAAAFALLAPEAWRHALRATPGVTSDALSAMPAAIVIAAMQPGAALVAGLLLGEQRVRAYAAFRACHAVARLLGALWAGSVWGDVATVLWAQATADMALVAVGLFVAVRRHLARDGWRAARASARSLLSLGLPFSISVLAYQVLMDAEKLAVGMARSVEDFAYYATPAAILTRLGVFAGAACAFLIPRLASLAADGKGREAAETTSRAARFLAAGSLASAVPLACLAPELLSLWLDPEFAARSARAARILAVGLAIFSIGQAAHAVVRARSSVWALPALYAVEVPVHLVVAGLLVTVWGVAGAAAAWTLRVALDVVLQRRLAARALPGSTGSAATLFAVVGAATAAALVCETLRPPVAARLVAAALSIAAAPLLLSAADRAALGRLWPRRN